METITSERDSYTAIAIQNNIANTKALTMWLGLFFPAVMLPNKQPASNNHRDRTSDLLLLRPCPYDHLVKTLKKHYHVTQQIPTQS